MPPGEVPIFRGFWAIKRAVPKNRPGCGLWQARQVPAFDKPVIYFVRVTLLDLLLTVNVSLPVTFST